MNQRMIVLIALMVFLVTATGSLAQPRPRLDATNWYFGANAGLSFAGGAPVPLTNGQLNTLDGSAVANDPGTGRLLFYTDGKSIWDSTHQQMPGGTGRTANESSAQAALIVPHPGKPGQFFVFTTGAHDSPDRAFRYAVVDMNGRDGRGEVILTNVLLLADGTEKVAATRHCNGRDYWVVTHESGSDIFSAYRIGRRGIEAVVESPVGAMYGSSDVAGTIQISPNGGTIAVASNTLNLLELFDFDNATGTITNPRIVASDDRYFGMEFSHDNSKLYANTLPMDPAPASLYQFDLQSGDLQTIRSSRFRLEQVTGSWQGGQLQMGPDGKIYVSWRSSSALGVINSPNLAGAACAYTPNGLALAGRSTQYGLPNFIDSDVSGVETDLMELEISWVSPTIDIGAGEAGVLHVIICNRSREVVTSLELRSALPSGLTSAGGGSVVLSVPPLEPNECDTIDVAITVASGIPADQTLNVCVSARGIGSDSLCVPETRACAQVRVTAPEGPVDVGPVDYTFNFAPGCPGTTVSFDALFHSRQRTDTIVSLQFVGPDARYFRWEGPTPIRFAIQPTTDQWLPLSFRRTAEGPVSGAMIIATAQGDTFRIGLRSSATPALSPIFDVVEIGVGDRAGMVDTCFDVVNTSGYGLRLLEAFRYGSASGSAATISEPLLPADVGSGERIRVCIHVENHAKDRDDTIVIGAREAVEVSPRCLRHYFVITSRQLPTTEVVTGEKGMNRDLALTIAPNPVGDRAYATIELGAQEEVCIDVVDVTGRTRRSIGCFTLAGGRNVIPVDVRDLSVGTYYVVIRRSGDLRSVAPLHVAR